MIRPRIWLNATLLVGSIVSFGSFAVADKAACAEASTRGQTLRDDGKYLDARASFVACASDSCPAVIRQDCGDWLAQLDKSIPSIVLVVRDAAGHDLSNASVTVDGITVALDGRPHIVDPGSHSLHAQFADGRSTDDHVIVRAGEQNRAIVMQAPAVATTTVTPTARVEPQTPSAPEPSPSRSYTPSIVLGAVSVVALGSFITFGLMGKADVDNLRATCAPYCAQSDLDAAKLKLTIADVSLAIGAAVLVTAVVLLFVPRASRPTTTGVRFDWTTGAGGRF